MITPLTSEQIAILHHTVNLAAGGRYCGGGKAMNALADMGLMLYIGTPAWCPDPFYAITDKGREALKFSQNACPPDHMSATTILAAPKLPAHAGRGAASFSVSYFRHLRANWVIAAKGLALAIFHFAHGLIPCRWTDHEFWNLNLTKP